MAQLTRSLLIAFRQLLQELHHANTVRHLDGNDDAADWRWRFLRHDVPRSVAVRHHVRPRLPPEAFVDRSDSDDFRGHRSVDGCARFHDSLRRIPRDGRDTTQSLSSLGLASWRTDILRRLHGHHLHAEDRLDRHSVLPQHRHILLHNLLEDVLEDGSADTSNVHRLNAIQ